jgi:hypothetical protein|tara:strand:+ start:406 stop:573 length:168 start_codon:yes stop_codon:yes gene_type:complete
VQNARENCPASGQPMSQQCDEFPVLWDGSFVQTMPISCAPNKNVSLVEAVLNMEI